MECKLKRLGKQDITSFKKLILLFQEVFESENPLHADNTYLLNLLGNPAFIACCAFAENEIVGGFTAFELKLYYPENSEIFIYDIAVNPNFQRKGISKKLLLWLKGYCKENAIGVIFVSANEEDEHAVEFYRATGGRAEKVINFTYFIT